MLDSEFADVWYGLTKRPTPETLSIIDAHPATAWPRVPVGSGWCLLVWSRILKFVSHR